MDTLQNVCHDILRIFIFLKTFRQRQSIKVIGLYSNTTTQKNISEICHAKGLILKFYQLLDKSFTEQEH